MKSKLLTIILFSVFLAGTAQGQVWKYALEAVDYSLVRTVDSATTLMYVQKSATEAWFVLREDALNSTLAVPLPVGCQVRDMRVDNGMAYFCGTFLGYEGVFGRFKIVSVFHAGAGIEFHHCYRGLYDYVYATDFKRLKLYEDGGVVCLAMVGETLFGYTNGTPSTTIASATPTGGGGWTVEYYVNKGNPIRFTDVAVMDDCIVGVGCDTVGVGCYLKPFWRTSAFVQYPTTPTVMYRLNATAPVGDVLAARLDTDMLGLVQYDNMASGVTVDLHRVLFFTPGVPDAVVKSQVFDCGISPVGAAWALREFAVGNQLEAFVLAHAPCPVTGVAGLHDWVMRFDTPPVATPVPLHMLRPVSGSLFHSLDLDHSLTLPRLSGMEPSLIETGALGYEGTPCREHHVMAAAPAGPMLSAVTVDDGTAAATISSFLYAVPVEAIQRKLQCLDE